MDTLLLEEYRCKCGKLLLKGLFLGGTLEIKCNRCGEINKLGILKITDDTISYILIVNARGIITNISDSACLILKYTAPELIGSPFSSINPSMTNLMDKKILSVMTTKNKFRLDTVHQSKDGQKIPVSIIMRLHQSINNNSYLLIFATIKKPTITTNSRDLDAADFLQEGCDYYFDIDKNGIFEYLSPSVEKVFGIVPANVIGKLYFESQLASKKASDIKSFLYYSAKEQPFRIVNRSKAEQYFTAKFSENGEFAGYRIMGWHTNSNVS